MSLLSRQLIQFYESLVPPALPIGFDVLHPQSQKEVKSIVRKFFTKYYNDNRPRKILLGINPGRLGAGITGINFTAPLQLKEYCGIDHPWENSTELSAAFIYEVIQAYGGIERFYGDYFIGAVSPLGFTRQGININYYDDPRLLKAVSSFIESTLTSHTQMGFDLTTCICIGEGKNLAYLKKLNQRNGYFGEIIGLPHPRFIMQYRRKQKDSFIRQYLQVLGS